MKVIQVELAANELLVYKGRAIERDVLNAVIDTNKRLLWAFVSGKDGEIRAIPYSESHVIWLAEEDITKPEEVEI